MKKLYISLIFIVTLATLSPSIYAIAKKGNPPEETCLNEAVIQIK
ncbi:hypothetical protein [Cytobacillus massiliigabonensis]|nr:hypothetical protein [Cytobacillus massiliigabonensis]